MASRASEDHRAAQAALATLIAGLIAHAWARLLDPHDLKGTTPKLVVAIEAIVKHYGQASAAASLDHYRQERRAAGISGRPVLHMPPATPQDRVEAAVGHAVTNLYGPVTPEVEQKAQDALTAEVEQLVLNQGREALIEAAATDKEAKGWARVPEPGACSFCALLATRGAVYSKHSFDESNAKFTGAGKFKAHNNCRCGVEPVFNAYEPTAQIRQWQADYKRLTEEYGKSGRDIHVAWRQHIEGRPVTGALTKPYTRAN